MKKDPQVFIKHILDSIDAVEHYTKNLSEDQFLRSLEKQDAIVRRVEIIGEAVRNISADFRREYPDIPWRKISGMRDKLVHEYFGVDLELVWAVVKKDLPSFKRQIKNLLIKN